MKNKSEKPYVICKLHMTCGSQNYELLTASRGQRSRNEANFPDHFPLPSLQSAFALFAFFADAPVLAVLVLLAELDALGSAVNSGDGAAVVKLNVAPNELRVVGVQTF